jgi:hypothetical protein
MARTPASKLPPLPPRDTVVEDTAWGCFFALGFAVIAILLMAWLFASWTT